MNRELAQGHREEAVLTSEEQLLLQKLQQLAREGKELGPEVVALAKEYLRWSYDDPASLVRAAYFMANDPFLGREVRTINAEFAAAESDGLEDD